MKTFSLKHIISLLALLVAVQVSFAQQKITGRVADQDNNPITGVAVKIKGTSAATITGKNGTYTITAPSDSDKTITFSHIGFVPTDRSISGSVVDVQMESDVTDIEDVVVVGYGKVRKSDLTGSVVSVKIDDIEATQVTSFDKLLQGRAAGVQVTTGSSAPGGAVSIKIRGTSSFNSTGEPLYVVDGIILNSASQDVMNPIGSTGQETQNALTSINPQDIASMEILKDASATAIYGSQGANGVILITTKSGTTDTPKVEYTTSIELSEVRKKIPVLDLAGFIQYAEDVGYKKMSADTLREVNWQDYTMRRAVSQTHRVSVSGRSKGSNYYIAAGYLNDKGILKNTDVSQGDLRVNYDLTLNPKVKVGTKTTLTNRVNNMTQGTEPGGTQNATRATNMMRQMLGSKPYVTNYNNAGDEIDDETVKGTDIWLRNYEDLSKEYRINATVYADLKPKEWLSFKSSFGADYRNKTRQRWYGEHIDQARNGRGALSDMVSFRYNIDNVLSLSPKLSTGQRLDVMLGNSVSSADNRNSTISAENFPDHEWRTSAISTALSQKPGYASDRQTLVSFFTRVLYSYDERYVVTATLRADGSSKFSKENRFSYFPSFAFAWRVNQEEFMSGVKQISTLKMRVGWGLVGNQGLSPYQTLATYNSIKMADPLSNYNSYNDGQFIMGIKPSRLSNPDLKWETTEQYNAGLDVGLFKNRIQLTVDIYQKYTKDLLQSIAVPPLTGFTSQWVNRGKIENKGVEISLEALLIAKRDFSWSFNGNISFNRNKVSDIGIPDAQWGALYGSAFVGADVGNDSQYFKMPANIFMQGHPVGLFYGFKTDGLVQQEDIDRGDLPTYRGTTLQPGDIKYVNLVDNEGSVNNIDDNDKTIIGNPNPDFVYGFATSFSYKRLTLSATFNGTYGNDIVNGNLMQENDSSPSNPANNINNIRSAAYFQAWTPENTNTNYPRLRKTNNSGDFTDRIVEDGSHLRLANVTLSYYIPLKKPSFVKNIGISFTARNLFVITNYSGWDPDVSSFSSSTQRVGVDWGSYPATRSYLFGLNLIF